MVGSWRAPEEVHELGVADLLGVEGHLDGLGVTGVPGAHLLVRRRLGVPAHEADGGGHDAGLLAEGVFDAPEATGGEGGPLGCLERVGPLGERQSVGGQARLLMGGVLRRRGSQADQGQRAGHQGGD